MFLKSYTGLSDDGLIEMLWRQHPYADVLWGAHRPGQTYKEWQNCQCHPQSHSRRTVVRELQKVLNEKLQGALHDKNLCLSDATCYESYMRFPTDVKLLWECCEWLQSLIAKTCKSLKERLPRNKYHDIDRARLAYPKQRKHTSVVF